MTIITMIIPAGVAAIVIMMTITTNTIMTITTTMMSVISVGTAMTTKLWAYSLTSARLQTIGSRSRGPFSRTTNHVA